MFSSSLYSVFNSLYVHCVAVDFGRFFHNLVGVAARKAVLRFAMKEEGKEGRLNLRKEERGEGSEEGDERKEKKGEKGKKVRMGQCIGKGEENMEEEMTLAS